jgi:hypothetical protein
MRILGFLKFTESISLSQYKKWNVYQNREFYEKMETYFRKFKDHNKNYDRIYFDFKVNPEEFEFSIPTEILDFLNWNGIIIRDYTSGICIDKDGREIRIGKLLRRMEEYDLLDKYAKSKENTLRNIGDLMIVISRHPYDIIGMSTNRGWTTCHDLNDKRYGGQHLYNIEEILRKGSLISYVIRKDDRDIKNPISRCLIENGYGDELEVDDNVYGTNIPGFQEFLYKWVDEFNINNE